MHPKIAKRLSTNSKSLMEYQLFNKLPKLRVLERTPLFKLLEKINPRDRAQIIHVKIGRHLGYSRELEFSTAEQLWRWLGEGKEIGEWETIPCERTSIKSFHKKLKIKDLLEASSKYPKHLEDQD